jgi:hypothetical protein
MQEDYHFPELKTFGSDFMKYLVKSKFNKNEVIKEIYDLPDPGNQEELKHYYDQNYHIFCECNDMKVAFHFSYRDSQNGRAYFLVRNNYLDQRSKVPLHKANCRHSENSPFADLEPDKDGKIISNIIFHTGRENKAEKGQKAAASLRSFDEKMEKERYLFSERKKDGELGSLFYKLFLNAYRGFVDGSSENTSITLFKFGTSFRRYLKTTNQYIRIRRETKSILELLDKNELFIGFFNDADVKYQEKIAAIELKSFCMDQKELEKKLRNKEKRPRKTIPYYVLENQFSHIVKQKSGKVVEFFSGNYILIGFKSKDPKYPNGLDLNNIAIIKCSSIGLPVDSHLEGRMADKLAKSRFKHYKPIYQEGKDYNYWLPDFIVFKGKKRIIVEIFGMNEKNYIENKEAKIIKGNEMSRDNEDTGYVYIDVLKNENENDLIMKIENA